MTKRTTDSAPIGQHFGKLMVLQEGPLTGKRNRRTMLCRCDCGTEKVITLEKLRSGRSKSCGCLRREVASLVGKQNRTHGKTKERIYNIWRSMVQRCRDANHTNYPSYGSRGIQVCDEWANSFDAFYYDMGEPPSEHHTLDRRDTNGHYNRENCRWVTMDVQQNNRRNNVKVTVNGKTQSVAAWARERGIPEGTIRYRLKHGWTHVEAIFGRVYPS